MNKINSILALINKFRSFIIKSNLLFIKKNILISFSGGQDSTCLLVLLILLKKQLSLHFEMIYCNHLWNLNKNIILAINIKKNFTEKSARLWRYSIIYRTSQFYNYEIILTAHTKTDQIETLLLNLFRGSSKDGLSIFSNNRFLVSKSTKEIFLSKKDLNL